MRIKYNVKNKGVIYIQSDKVILIIIIIIEKILQIFSGIDCWNNDNLLYV